MRRALINLLDNASDAITGNDDIGGAGTITVSTRIDDGHLEIEVADDGAGIEREALEKIHEPLFSTKPFGVGLGVPIVHRVMEEHGGRFVITSDQGCGTRAVLWLPLSRDESVARTPAC